MSQGQYLPEGLYTQNRHLSLSEAGMKQAIDTGVILQGTVTKCDSMHTLYCDVGNFKGIILPDEATYEDNVKSKAIAVISKVGKSVCFKVTGCENGLYTLSRKAAQLEALEYFMSYLNEGDVVTGKITHIEPFGVFVDIGCGNISLIGIENISVSRISSPFERFKTGQEIFCAVKAVDFEQKRITLTHKELLGTWLQNSSKFSSGETVRGIVRGIESYGIFVELAPNLSGLSEYRADVTACSAVSVYIKSIIPEKMKIKLLIIDTLEENAKTFITPSDYYITSGHIDRFLYTPEKCREKIIETVF